MKRVNKGDRQKRCQVVGKGGDKEKKKRERGLIEKAELRKEKDEEEG